MTYIRHFFSVERNVRSLHLWSGPVGVHLFWPDVWKSRLDWCWHWGPPCA